MPQRTLVSTSLSLYLGKWNQHRYWTSYTLTWIQELRLLSVLVTLWLVFKTRPCNCPAGIVQISGSPWVSSGYAHHHLRCDRTCSWNPQSEFTQLSSETWDGIYSHSLKSSFILCRRSRKLCLWWADFCTRDEGGLCEYTTCTVTVHSLEQMLNDFCWPYFLFMLKVQSFQTVLVFAFKAWGRIKPSK